MEAADRVEKGDRWITVKMLKAGDMIFIELSNSMTGRPSVKDNRLVTTKREEMCIRDRYQRLNTDDIRILP